MVNQVISVNRWWGRWTRDDSLRYLIWVDAGRPHNSRPELAPRRALHVTPGRYPRHDNHPPPSRTMIDAIVDDLPPDSRPHTLTIRGQS
jgi:hypothetical protein